MLRFVYLHHTMVSCGSMYAPQCLGFIFSALHHFCFSREFVHCMSCSIGKASHTTLCLSLLRRSNDMQCVG